MYSDFYTQKRVRSFRRRKGISNENYAQAVIVALVMFVGILVIADYATAQRDLTAAQVEYTSVVDEAL